MCIIGTFDEEIIDADQMQQHRMRRDKRLT